MKIQWYPGHMTKTRRMIADQLRNVDAVCEILDARIPISSRNPDVDALTVGKPRLVVLNRVDQADPSATRRWAAWFRSHGCEVLETNAKSGGVRQQFVTSIQKLLEDKLRAYAQKGQAGRIVRVMVLGIPNVGKSTLINRVSGRKTARAEDRPGVTRAGQWVPVGEQLELLDTPGILWPRFDDETVGMNLAYTGAVKDDILDVEELAAHLMSILKERYPAALTARYQIDPASAENGYELLELAGRRRGFLISGGEVDTERMARILLDEFRGGKLGNFTLEYPEDLRQ